MQPSNLFRFISSPVFKSFISLTVLSKSLLPTFKIDLSLGVDEFDNP